MRTLSDVAPPRGYRFPEYEYTVVMKNGNIIERSAPMRGSEIAAYVGHKHMGGWQFVTSEQREKK